MAVFLSPVGGVAAQFFTNTGSVLTGGKLYTYLAGTTTPAATYTSAAGATFNTNPIVLDAAGRVPSSGEIWLGQSVQYKFVLKDSNDVLIGTYDNVTGINSNFVNYNALEEIQVATAAQTVFNLTNSYQPGTNTLSVFVDGVNQYDGSSYSYIETSSTRVTFTQGLHVGALVKFTTAVTLSAGVISSNLVTYQPAGTGAVATTVQAKLRETVSVKDFGATGNGTTDDTAAVVAALAASNAVYFPAGTYLVSGNINIVNKSLYGVPSNSTGSTSVSIIKLSGSNTNISLFVNGGNISTPWGSGGGCLLQNLTLRGNWDGSTPNSETNISNIGALFKWWSGAYVKIQNCYFVNSFGFGVFSYQLGYSNIQNSFVSTCAKNGIHLEAPSGDLAITSTTINDCSINSCQGVAPTGGSGVYIKNGFYCDLNGNVIEDVLVGVYIDGSDNRSITLFENHMESTTNGGVRYVGSGTDLCLFSNIFASTPYFVQTNPAFQDYKAIGNYQLDDQYTLPTVRAFAQQVLLTNAAPVAVINQVTLPIGTWLVNASWIGTQSSGAGQMSSRQQFALNNSAAFPSYPGTPSSYEYATVRGDVSSTVNTADGFMNGTLSFIVNITTPQTVYLYGGPTSITSTLVVACTGSIFATKINGAYLSS